MDGARAAAAGRPWLAVALIGVALAAGLGTPWFLDYDEAVYAEVSRTMLVSGDWVRPQWNGAVFYEKPALFYWLTASLYAAIGVTPVAPRAISLLATLAGLAFLAAEVRRRLDARAAEAAVWVAGATLLPFSLGRLGLLDAALVAAITAALLAFARGLEEELAGRRRGWLAAGYLAAGLATALKGPAFPLLIGAILLADALARRRVAATLRASGMAWGVPLLLAVGTPWYVLAWRADGRAFLDELVGRHTLARVAAPLQGHGGPLWYYLPVLALGVMPFAALLPGALAALRRRDEPARRLAWLAAAWGAVPVLAFSLAATKLPQYVAPAIPAAAVLVALAAAGPAPAWRRRSWHAVLLSTALLAAAIGALPVVLARAPAIPDDAVARSLPGLACLSPAWRWAFVVPALVMLAGAAAAWRRGVRGETLAAVRALGVAGAVSFAALGVVAGHLVQTVAIAPVAALARQADTALPAGAPIHLVQLNHRVTPALATGRTLVFLSAKRDGDRERLRALLSGSESVRVIVPAPWWEELRGSLGGRELARECGHVLVGESTAAPTARPAGT